MRSKYLLLLLLCAGCPPPDSLFPPPTVEIEAPQVIASGADVFLLARVTSRVGIESFSWSILSSQATTGVTLLTSNEPVAHLRTTGPGFFTVQLTVKDANGEDTDSVQIEVKERPIGRTQLVSGVQLDSSVGERVFAAGDLNGDGNNDAILADPRGVIDFVESGFIEIYLGSRAGLQSEPLIRLHSPDPQANEGFGSSVATGDFDGDGARDIAVGRPGFRVGNQLDIGQVLIFFGGDNFSSAPLIISTPSTDFGGFVEGDRFGEALAAADWDLDGIDDLAISAPARDRFETNFSESGEIFLYKGNTERNFTTPHSAISRENAKIGVGEPEHLGTVMVLLPSVCGDERPDLAASVPGFDIDDQRPDTGAVLIFCAGSQNFFESADVLFFLPNNPAPGDEFGASIASLGDADFDNQTEFVIGAPGRNGGKGSIFVIGLAGQNQLELTAPEGITGGRFGAVLAGADLDGSGTKDLVVGLPDDGPGALLVFPASPLGFLPPIRIESPSLEIENFGKSLADVGDVDEDQFEDLLAGVPGLPAGGVRLIF